ncbi:uncharacterized protein LOC116608366 isoform X2 [Nematostella vectensis]|uniref:uncharacterized protein LOC116608366 isoform X2 n=1 Tax=Nematostella vectensis TaxID=45351 RepID=UPI002077345A|nr:uncharacterized protein LOC116608366 isoform X2 [Nematostella vectensis]
MSTHRHVMFSVLYTHQKAKKRKTWQDGVVKFICSTNKASLYSEDNKLLDSLFVRQEQICNGAELESDKYLITIEEQLNRTSNDDFRQSLSSSHGTMLQSSSTFHDNPLPSSSSSVKSSSFGLSAGRKPAFKRKNLGFQAPRFVERFEEEFPCIPPQPPSKKLRVTENEDLVLTPSSNHGSTAQDKNMCRSRRGTSFPSHLTLGLPGNTGITSSESFPIPENSPFVPRNVPNIDEPGNDLTTANRLLQARGRNNPHEKTPVVQSVNMQSAETDSGSYGADSASNKKRDALQIMALFGKRNEQTSTTSRGQASEMVYGRDKMQANSFQTTRVPGDSPVSLVSNSETSVNFCSNPRKLLNLCKTTKDINENQSDKFGNWSDRRDESGVKLSDVSPYRLNRLDRFSSGLSNNPFPAIDKSISSPGVLVNPDNMDTTLVLTPDSCVFSPDDCKTFNSNTTLETDAGTGELPNDEEVVKGHVNCTPCATTFFSKADMLPRSRRHIVNGSNLDEETDAFSCSSRFDLVRDNVDEHVHMLPSSNNDMDISTGESDILSYSGRDIVKEVNVDGNADMLPSSSRVNDEKSLIQDDIFDHPERLFSLDESLLLEDFEMASWEQHASFEPGRKAPSSKVAEVINKESRKSSGESDMRIENQWSAFSSSKESEDVVCGPSHGSIEKEGYTLISDENPMKSEHKTSYEKQATISPFNVKEQDFKIDADSNRDCIGVDSDVLMSHKTLRDGNKSRDRNTRNRIVKETMLKEQQNEEAYVVGTNSILSSGVKAKDDVQHKGFKEWAGDKMVFDQTPTEETEVREQEEEEEDVYVDGTDTILSSGEMRKTESAVKGNNEWSGAMPPTCSKRLQSLLTGHQDNRFSNEEDTFESSEDTERLFTQEQSIATNESSLTLYEKEPDYSQDSIPTKSFTQPKINNRVAKLFNAFLRSKNMECLQDKQQKALAPAVNPMSNHLFHLPHETPRHTTHTPRVSKHPLFDFAALSESSRFSDAQTKDSLTSSNVESRLRTREAQHCVSVHRNSAQDQQMTINHRDMGVDPRRQRLGTTPMVPFEGPCNDEMFMVPDICEDPLTSINHMLSPEFYPLREEFAPQKVVPIVKTNVVSPGAAKVGKESLWKGSLSSQTVQRSYPSFDLASFDTETAQIDTSDDLAWVDNIQTSEPHRITTNESMLFDDTNAVLTESLQAQAVPQAPQPNTREAPRRQAVLSCPDDKRPLSSGLVELEAVVPSREGFLLDEWSGLHSGDSILKKFDGNVGISGTLKSMDQDQFSSAELLDQSIGCNSQEERHHQRRHHKPEVILEYSLNQWPSKHEVCYNGRRNAGLDPDEDDVTCKKENHITGTIDSTMDVDRPFFGPNSDGRFHETSSRKTRAEMTDRITRSIDDSSTHAKRRYQGGSFSDGQFYKNSRRERSGLCASGKYVDRCNQIASNSDGLYYESSNRDTANQVNSSGRDAERCYHFTSRSDGPPEIASRENVNEVSSDLCVTQMFHEDERMLLDACASGFHQDDEAEQTWLSPNVNNDSKQRGEVDDCPEGTSLDFAPGNMLQECYKANITSTASSGLSLEGDASECATRMTSRARRAHAPFRRMGLSKGNKRFVPPVQDHSSNTQTSMCSPNNSECELSMTGELSFPTAKECESTTTPSRYVTIPVAFESAPRYRQVMKTALREHLNIILFELSKSYHSALRKVDVSGYSSHDTGSSSGRKGPSCPHGVGNLRAVKKEGPNKLFKWADEYQSSSCGTGSARSGRDHKPSLSTPDTISSFMKTHGVMLYCECRFVRKQKDTFGRGAARGGYRYSRRGSNNIATNTKKGIFLELSRKESSSMYSKNDIWIVSKSLSFDASFTFVAKSVYYGPLSSGELEIEPLTGYSPSNWHSGEQVHALLACNAGNELTCTETIDEHVKPQGMPLLDRLLTMPSSNHRPSVARRSQSSSFVPPTRDGSQQCTMPVSWGDMINLAEEYTDRYHLNEDQSAAMRECVGMFSTMDPDFLPTPITLIHGVFGSGKSYLLAVIIVFLLEVFKMCDSNAERASSTPWKILVSSTTNVAVDRILIGLLDLGYDEFVRVGSVRKIAKSVLPYSVHSAGSDTQELKELQAMLKGDVSPTERTLIRKSIEKQKLGINKKRLVEAQVVGVTCAACVFPCMEKMKFPILLLDECSQMTEPSSLLPLARFECQKLLLVGDPKQLSPTIQGSEPEHDKGLEQTLFDRLIKLGYHPTMLRVQYRCHPVISAIANKLFYDSQLKDGVTSEERSPIVDFAPTLCFYNVSRGQEKHGQDGSYYNEEEAKFVVFMIDHLLEAGVEPAQIGVITLYKSQLRTITAHLAASKSASHSEMKGVQISTVDAFQGGEKDVVLLSCVRTKRVGFIDCDRRTNVALTRAKRHLLIIGSLRMLSSNAVWGNVIQHCRDIPEGIVKAEDFVTSFKENLPDQQQDRH